MGGSAAAQANLNGGFEGTEVGVVTDLAAGIDGWTMEASTALTAAPEFAVVDDTVHTGDRALRVTVNQAGANSWDIQAIAEPVAAVPGRTYQYSVWARTAEGGATASFTVGNAAFQEYGRLGDQALTTEWREFTLQFTVNDTSTVIRAPIHFSFAGNVGSTIYIDDLTIVDPEAGALPVVVEAEGGTLGSEFEVVDEDTLSYVAITTDVTETTGTGTYPGENRTASYEVTFAEPGWYDLYARVYVGPETFNDDSFFYADSFGVKDPAVADDWIIANQLASAGYTEPDDFVTGLGTAGSEVWKWVNLSENSFNGIPSDSFYVAPGALMQTFEIGAREDGLRFDRLAFGRSDLYFTVANLDNGEPGSEDMGPGVVIAYPERPLADDLEKFLGNIYSPSQVTDFERYWNYVIAENAGKWGSVEGTRDQMNWAALDASYALAKENGLEYNFHVLLWGAQQPGWISALEPAEQLEEIREWMEAVAERYPDMDVVQVANEILPTHNPPDGQNGRADYKEALGGDGETGYDYVIAAFEMAREIFPEGTRLMLNDYGILGSTGGAQQYLEVIGLLQDRGLIDVIGVQGHAFSTGPGAPIGQVLDMLGATGLPIQVTEMDVDGSPNGTDAQSDQAQLLSMQRIFPVIWEHPSVEGVTFWGWRPGLWRDDQEAYLVRATGEHRPALDWLIEYMEAYRAVGAEPGAGAAAARLVGNRPNPFAAGTQIRYALSQPADVRLDVFDAVGRRVATLVDGFIPAGDHEAVFHGAGLAPGVYLYRLETGTTVETRSMVLAR